MIVSNSNVNVSASNQSENNKVSFNVKSDANTNTASSANNAVQSEKDVSVENTNSVSEQSTVSQNTVNKNTDSQTVQPVVKEEQSVEKTTNVEKVVQPATVKKVQSQPVVERQVVKRPVVDEKANVSNQSVNVSPTNIEKENNNFAKAPVANVEKNVEMKPVQTQSKAVQSSNIEKNVSSENEEINLATVQGEASARETASSAMDNVAPAMLNQARNDEKRDEDMELAQSITANIKYEYNGQVVGTASETVNGDQAVDVSAHVPSGYEVSPTYKPATSVPVSNGQATFIVPVVKAQNTTPTSNKITKDVINYTNNGKTISSVTLPSDGSAVNVSAHCPSGYQVDPKYQPQSVVGKNGVATFNVPVVPKTNSGSTTVKPAQPASKDVINYTYNGKTISSVTLPANDSNPVDVGAHLPNGYEIAPSYKPSTVNVVNGVATFNVPVVPKSSSNTNSGSQSNPSTSGSTTVDGSDVHSTGSNQVKVTINYTYNGKTVGSATENVTSGANIDVNSHLPQGYQVAPSYKPGSQTVSGNTATINVPVEPVSNSNTIKTTINYQYNGKTVGTATINNPKGQPVDVSKNIPAGYKVAPSFKPGNTKVVNGVATLDVPVVPANGSNTNGSSSSNSSSSSSSNSSSANSSSSTNKGTSSSNTSSNNGSGMAPATSGSEGTNISGNGSNTSSSANNSNVDSDSGAENTSSDSSSDSGLAPATSGSKGTDVSGNSSNTNSANGSASGNTSSNTSAQGSTTAPATQSKPANSSNPSANTSANGENGSSAMAGGNSTTPGKTASDVNNGSSNKGGQSQAQSQNDSKTTVSDNGNVKTESSSNSGTADSIAALEKKTGLPAAEIKKMLAIAEANGGKAQFQNEQQHVYHVGSQGKTVAEPTGSAVSAPVEETSTPAQSASAPIETASATSATSGSASSSVASSSNVSNSNALPETGMANEGIEFAAAMLAMAGIAMAKREHEE